MNEEDILPLQDPNDARTRAQFTRSTYNENNARLFMPLFQAIIDSRFTIEKGIPWNALKSCSPKSLYVKAADALKWFFDKEVDETRLKIAEGKETGPQPFTTLKLNYCWSKETDALVLRRKLKKASTRTPKEIKFVNVATNPEFNTGAKVISWDATMSQPPAIDPSDPQPVSMAEVTSWRDMVLNIIQAGEYGKVHKVEVETLSPDDMNWLAQVFDGVTKLGIDYVITDGVNNDHKMIQIMKEKA